MKAYIWFALLCCGALPLYTGIIFASSLHHLELLFASIHCNDMVPFHHLLMFDQEEHWEIFRGSWV